MRQIVLDTETTGLDPSQGHRIIEIGCVELLHRRLTGNHLHLYVNPEREVDAGAREVHGISDEFLADKPVFAAVADDFLEFVKGAQLIIHNAPFDIGFLNHELRALGKGHPPMDEYCPILDTLVMARNKHPGKKNSLDALCRHYQVDNTQRKLHGALLDAEILADVYLRMDAGQSSLLQDDEQPERKAPEKARKAAAKGAPLRIIRASPEEIAAHEARLQEIEKISENGCLWLKEAEGQG